MTRVPDPCTHGIQSDRGSDVRRLHRAESHPWGSAANQTFNLESSVLIEWKAEE